jgi:alpha-glucosidase
MSMVMGLGLSGLAFTGPDIGGFQGGADGELLVRWMQLGAFLPFFRGHAALYSPNQEPWAFGEPYTSLNRSAIELRYQLLPYLYTAVWQCAQTGMPIVRPLVMAWPDDSRACALDDQFLCGDALLVAPVCQPGATSREVYLPAGSWYDFWTNERHDGPRAVAVTAPLDRIPVFVRAGAVLPMWPVLQHVGERPLERLFLHAYVGDGKSCLYEDDGHSVQYMRGEYRVSSFECRALASGMSVACERQGPHKPEYSILEWHVHGLGQRPGRASADDRPVQSLSWNEHSRTLRFETGEACSIQLA